ncbi:hypothetical protein IQ231_12600 [Cuspidothrix issatschenkoi LEGE 03284]|nr:hypothetical protein [Cuspidothrix issatschenkoi]MBE9232496.1 hypothetical protein [Cuspidothrix issatschenkoi LEGE 03284]
MIRTAQLSDSPITLNPNKRSHFINLTYKRSHFINPTYERSHFINLTYG